MLEKYSRADEAKIKELTLAIEKLTESSTKATRDLQSEALETQAQRIGLDKAANDFQRLHSEQQALTATWEKVLAQMEQRDSEIEQEAEHYSELRQGITQQVGGTGRALSSMLMRVTTVQGITELSILFFGLVGAAAQGERSLFEGGEQIQQRDGTRNPPDRTRHDEDRCGRGRRGETVGRLEGRAGLVTDHAESSDG